MLTSLCEVVHIKMSFMALSNGALTSSLISMCANQVYVAICIDGVLWVSDKNSS